MSALMRIFRAGRLRFSLRGLSSEAETIAEGLPAFTPLRTNVPTMYTCAPLEPIVELDSISAQTGSLFKQTATYVSPKLLNYELPRDGLPEFAFVGRSNVGKSTLVGTLLGDKSLVKISKAPGCTQNVNYFAFETKKKVKLTYLVDLPGYGYAAAAKMDRKRWADTMTSFLKGRDFTVMRRVYVLIDSRRGLKTVDQDMMTMLNTAGLPYQVILTKTDCVSKRELALAVSSVFADMDKKSRNGCFPFVHAVSSKTGSGILDFKKDIARVIYRDFADMEDADPTSEKDYVEQ